jgi:NSS family neurotransmitter:Na+ symporter
VLAAAGSAIGLGNLWKFPYITWDNSGGAFVLVYLVCVLIIGLPIMMAEILIGRRTQKSPVPAFRLMGNRRWSLVGGLGVLTGFVILGYYTVIAGWTISSFLQCLEWSLEGYVAPENGAFDGFLANAPLQLLLSALFSTCTISVIWLGVSKGIERVTKTLMPILFLILCYLAVMAVTMPGFGKTLHFLFRPNFHELPMSGILEALGHAFFTLSLGMGVMITYGSYLGRRESITRVSGMVVFLDTLIAIFACLIMYTIIFSSTGMASEVSRSTVGMLFITLPKMFYSGLTGGTVIAPLFYILVGFAALTSTISLLETMVAYFIDSRQWRRHRATLFCGLATYLSTILCALSLGAVTGLSGFSLLAEKRGVLDHLDYLASNWLLPVGGLLTTLFIGWFVKKNVSLGELRMHDEAGNPTVYYKIWRFFIRFIAPAAILAVIIAVINGMDFS